MKLGVNIDHVATLRQARRGVEPEPVLAALVCEAAGADSIVVHLREDRRHIREQDLFLLKKAIRTRLNLEMSVSKEIVGIACEARPGQATLVPEKRQELTTEGGLDVTGNFKRIQRAMESLEKNGIGVSLFIDPDKRQIRAAKELGAKMLELHTGRFAEAKTMKLQDGFFRQIREAARFAKAEGFKVFAGHGLNYDNVARIAGIREIEELNIGYSIICRALFAGLGRAVREMRELIGD
ncbi:MAG: pyridoxine 5'-phosphate synthase [Candidatus Omnitrophica bacterium]|nr:pyridoxine 5'-phosphate synthase [Candidatus Omnitrophota bacterium]